MGLIETITAGLGLGNQVLGNKTSGYTPMWGTRDRDNAMLWTVLIVLMLSALLVALIFIRKK
ncbi:hypothetical protein [Phaeocystidibacter luteus]|uniref:Uncharacterized protein n=1 Tax=Phaeocystidibacter luteus TaxID=911197 RepID=A0A6N6RLY0_9FLAO|nr:hypothetical protein [Phaeocystidibacter luteus]KAB2814563.1 hypothetical protein F8C67_02150 [Phaeocystidibacter luteus]